jgi:hypothetical protein
VPGVPGSVMMAGMTVVVSPGAGLLTVVVVLMVVVFDAPSEPTREVTRLAAPARGAAIWLARLPAEPSEEAMTPAGDPALATAAWPWSPELARAVVGAKPKPGCC